MYLTVFASAGTMFVFCSFWVYHYVELELEANERETTGTSSSPTESVGYENVFSMSMEDGPSMSRPRMQEWRTSGKPARQETS